jgi:hypothetical protein
MNKSYSIYSITTYDDDRQSNHAIKDLNYAPRRALPLRLKGGY